MKLVMHSEQGVVDEIEDTHPDFATWLARTPPGWSNGYVWVTAEDDEVAARAMTPEEFDWWAAKVAEEEQA